MRWQCFQNLFFPWYLYCCIACSTHRTRDASKDTRQFHCTNKTFSTLPSSTQTACCDLHPRPLQRHDDAAARCVNTPRGLIGSRRRPLQPIKSKKAEREMDRKEDERGEAKTATASLRVGGGRWWGPPNHRLTHKHTSYSW